LNAPGGARSRLPDKPVSPALYHRYASLNPFDANKASEAPLLGLIMTQQRQ
jgi:hypothetical protein